MNGFGGLVATVGAAVGSAPPTQAPPTSDAPSIVTPAEPYTNDDAVDVTVNVPQDVVGDADATRSACTSPWATPSQPCSSSSRSDRPRSS